MPASGINKFIAGRTKKMSSEVKIIYWWMVVDEVGRQHSSISNKLDRKSPTLSVFMVTVTVKQSNLYDITKTWCFREG